MCLWLRRGTVDLAEVVALRMDVILIEILMMEVLVLIILAEANEAVVAAAVVMGAVLTAARKDISLESAPTKTHDLVAVEEVAAEVVMEDVLSAAKKDISLESAPTKTPVDLLVAVETEIVEEAEIAVPEERADVIIVEKQDTFLEIVHNREAIDTKLSVL